MDLPAWNAKLFADIRDRGRAGERLYLYVDRNLLAKLSDRPAQDALDDFCHAFRATMGTDPFRRGAAAARHWRRAGFPGEPPIVAHLAMAVLAVTEEPLVGTHSIYARQNRLLGFEATPTEPSGYGDDMISLWTVWNAWLDGPGSAYGVRTAVTHDHWSRQGWARSQALVRFADRLQIEQYIAAHGGVVSFPDLLAWLRLRRPDMERRFREEPALVILGDVLDEETARWRQEGPRVPNRSGGRGLLLYDDWMGSFHGALRVDDALAGRVVDLGSGEFRTADESDGVLTVATDVTTEVLLREGFEHRLTDGVVQRFGGESVYVLRGDPLVTGLLQVRSWDRRGTADVLVRQDRLPTVRAALSEHGVAAKESPAAKPGWSWFRHLTVSPTDTAVLACLGLARVAAATQSQPVLLQGGLRLRNTTYLVGGEPDLVVEGDELSKVEIDGSPQPLAAEPPRLRLADLYLDPAKHTIGTPLGDLTFTTVNFCREQAAASDIGIPVKRQPGGEPVFGSAVRDRTPEMIAGGLLTGVEVAEPMVVRRSASAEMLLITEHGEISEVRPGTAHWLRALDLEPTTIDVLAAIRTSTDAPVACVVLCNKHRVQAIAVPPGTPRMDGRVELRPRPDVLGQLATTVGTWSWISTPHPRIRQILSMAIRRTPSSPPVTVWRRPAEVAVRTDVDDGPLPDNPYDDVLTWLSEREYGRASIRDFGEAWEWACDRNGYPEMALWWRRALRTLEELGHIERDYGTRQVGVAPAVLVALPASSGLYVLTGARPVRLVERLATPDDPDPLVADAAEAWAVHVRSPLDGEGRPAGPQVIYLECDPAQRVTIRAGLLRLGVKLTGVTADALLELLPEIRRLDLVGEPLTMSPSRQMWTRRRTPQNVFDWVEVSVDAAPGFYCYQLSYRKMYAWRPTVGAELVRVAYEVGEWLARAEVGKTRLLLAEEGARRLLAAPADLPLPRMLSRALVLRTGLPPRIAQPRIGDKPYRIYGNVDARTAERVAHLLAQTPDHTGITTRLAA
ncbi:hypothetical protein [Micromonospora sp. NPDC005254]|uniref:hypothetical protein n=1 Tax=Micromonospora sp. NPDC005254 TaxID=3364229 RepID=UPI00369A0FA4